MLRTLSLTILLAAAMGCGDAILPDDSEPIPQNVEPSEPPPEPEPTPEPEPEPEPPEPAPEPVVETRYCPTAGEIHDVRDEHPEARTDVVIIPWPDADRFGENYELYHRSDAFEGTPSEVRLCKRIEFEQSEAVSVAEDHDCQVLKEGSQFKMVDGAVTAVCGALEWEISTDGQPHAPTGTLFERLEVVW